MHLPGLQKHPYLRRRESETMRIEIEIPKEFEDDYNKDKFDEFFCRVLSDIVDGTTCGRYERETAEMLQKAFEESKIAYDVETVVAKLEAKRNGYEEAGKVFNGTHGSGIRLSYALKQGAILEAMEIVRNGGKE